MHKTIGVMQPYFLPYIGYFQLMNLVDEFVIYDNIQYTKKGWINRNRMLSNGKDVYFTIPLQKGSDYLDVRERELSDTFPQERESTLRRIKESYKKTPEFQKAYPVIEKCFMNDEKNLFKFILFSLNQLRDYLGISANLVVSSEISMNHNLKSEDRVIEICKKRGASRYINPIGGVELYDKSRFKDQGIELSFLRANNIQYSQGNIEFVPFLSILDVIMFNDTKVISKHLLNFNLE